MLGQSQQKVTQLEEPRSNRYGSLANTVLLGILKDEPSEIEPVALKLVPINANLYARRHSSHNCSTSEHITLSTQPPAVPKRTCIPPQASNNPQIKLNVQTQLPKSRGPPPPLPPRSPASLLANKNIKQKQTCPENDLSKDTHNKSTTDCVFQFDNGIMHEFGKIPPAPNGPPPPAPKSFHKSAQHNNSVRQDSSLSSESFSQNSSPSYTTKTMKTPLLPRRTPNKVNAPLNTAPSAGDGGNGNTALTKSASTPASLQSIVRFHNGSNMSLHHRIIRDMRRSSSHHYITSARLNFRFAQIVMNAVALIAIGGGLAAYFKAFPTRTVEVVDLTNTNSTNSIPETAVANPAPGICLPVIVGFCKQHKVPYNYTVFPNYMGHFGQPDAQHELEVYDAVVDVRCYELASLFLCSVFVPKCGAGGIVVRPCCSLCLEMKRRCGFFLDVFGLALPEYLECDLFPESPDPEVCVGHHEVIEANLRAQKPVCEKGFQCDVKRCIPREWKCDGYVDCEDQTDEINCRNCKKGLIYCGRKKCISQDQMCDGIADCPFGQDERNCLRLSDNNGDEGRGKLEIFRPRLRKWAPACAKQWDRKSSKAVCTLLGYSNVTASRLTKPKELNIVSPAQKTTDTWRIDQNSKPSNMMQDFVSCAGKAYPTVHLVCMCGKTRKSYAEQKSLRIVGGKRSKPGNWPFLAALLGGPEEIFYCAGVLIADQWVLTASHCVGNHSDVSGWTIQLGITRRQAHSYYEQKMKVKRVIPHPMYNLGTAHDNDVALFQLTSPVTFHEHLVPVCLPQPNRELPPNTKCTVIGWGKKEDAGMSEYELEINEVEVPILNRDLCNTWLENRDLNVSNGMICAGYKEGGKDACQGDSGGPLLCRDKDDDPWFVGGIVSWGIKCAHPHLPGVYTFVPRYIPWIHQQMALYGK